jgi:cell division protein FtsZ
VRSAARTEPPPLAEPEWRLEPSPREAARTAAELQPDLIDDVEPELYFEEPALRLQGVADTRHEPSIAAPRGYGRAETYGADSDEPLFPAAHASEERRAKGGIMSLFGGRRRHEESYPEPRGGPIPQARSTSSAQLVEEEKLDEGEDLEIPSFLRRLAN